MTLLSKQDSCIPSWILTEEPPGRGSLDGGGLVVEHDVGALEIDAMRKLGSILILLAK
jgi:hypothetical protein